AIDLVLQRFPRLMPFGSICTGCPIQALCCLGGQLLLPLKLQTSNSKLLLYFNGCVTILTFVIPVLFTASITVAKAPNGTFSSQRTKTDCPRGSRNFCFSFAPISLMLIASLPRNTRWFLSIEITVRSSVISFTVRVFGTSTSMPDC